MVSYRPQKTPTFHAGILIEDWITKNGIETLNVAGPRASKDFRIYGLVTIILELAYNLEDKVPSSAQIHRFLAINA